MINDVNDKISYMRQQKKKDPENLETDKTMKNSI